MCRGPTRPCTTPTPPRPLRARLGSVVNQQDNPYPTLVFPVWHRKLATSLLTRQHLDFKAKYCCMFHLSVTVGIMMARPRPRQRRATVALGLAQAPEHSVTRQPVRIGYANCPRSWPHGYVNSSRRRWCASPSWPQPFNAYERCRTSCTSRDPGRVCSLVAPPAGVLPIVRCDLGRAGLDPVLLRDPFLAGLVL